MIYRHWITDPRLGKCLEMQSSCARTRRRGRCCRPGALASYSSIRIPVLMATLILAALPGRGMGQEASEADWHAIADEKCAASVPSAVIMAGGNAAMGTTASGRGYSVSVTRYRDDRTYDQEVRWGAGPGSKETTLEATPSRAIMANVMPMTPFKVPFARPWPGAPYWEIVLNGSPLCGMVVSGLLDYASEVKPILETLHREP
jgi:hypothetical protein